MKWILLSVLANTSATVFLKIAATHASTVSPGVNRLLFYAASLLSYAFAFVTYRQSLFHYSVGVSYASITSSTALLVGLIGVTVFSELLTANKVVGFALICAGIFFLSASNSSS